MGGYTLEIRLSGDSSSGLLSAVCGVCLVTGDTHFGVEYLTVVQVYAIRIMLRSI